MMSVEEFKTLKALVNIKEVIAEKKRNGKVVDCGIFSDDFSDYDADDDVDEKKDESESE